VIIAPTPKPGSFVRKLPEIKSEKDLLSFYGIKSKKGLIEYGALAGSEIPLLLDLNAITMHIGVFGRQEVEKVCFLYSFNILWIYNCFHCLFFNE